MELLTRLDICQVGRNNTRLTIETPGIGAECFTVRCQTIARHLMDSLQLHTTSKKSDIQRCKLHAVVPNKGDLLDTGFVAHHILQARTTN